MENNFNEVLKEKERLKQSNAPETGEIALDDARRVKILSPGRLVFKRFVRNRLAIAGVIILAAMFILAFLGPVVYPYTQTQIFYKYGDLTVDYASAANRTDYVNYMAPNAIDISYTVKNSMNSVISGMEKDGADQLTLTTDEKDVMYVRRMADNIYGVYSAGQTTLATWQGGGEIARYNSFTGEFLWSEDAKDEAFQGAAESAIAGEAGEFDHEGAAYKIEAGKKNQWVITSAEGRWQWLTEAPPGLDEAMAQGTATDGDGLDFTIDGKLYHMEKGENITLAGDEALAMICTTYVFDAYPGTEITDDFRVQALLAVCGDGSFTVDGSDYEAVPGDGEILLTHEGEVCAELSTLAIRSYSGADDLDIGFKEAVREQYEKMTAEELSQVTFNCQIPRLDEKGAVVKGDDGSVEYEDSEITMTRKVGQYVLTCRQTTYLIDIFSGPSRQHPFGTDGDGMDVMARMMYGGRVSLLVGFVVVFLEVLLGVVFGGIAGFFGGWIDNLIMRLVDVFYCIPTLPIMIILGAMLDAMKMNAYLRLVWMMAVLGILGWAGVARLVRGQILSLREQEFMTAAEATGIKAKHRIFRHLVPNVLPQLIVYATMSLGSVIIYESTLSYLGLGVKHPLATWGTMINSVASSSEAMIRYTYIWVPVGFLICLTVIAFNFVGDGLRDAFDPKMKR